MKREGKKSKTVRGGCSKIRKGGKKGARVREYKPQFLRFPSSLGNSQWEEQQWESLQSTVSFSAQLAKSAC